MSTHDPQWLPTAIELARRAGAMQLASFRQGVEVAHKGAIDLVTEVDVAVERMFRAEIGQRFPDHLVLAEELGGPTDVGSSPTWIFDPIDGTTNYAHGLPFFCVSIALEVDDALQVGVVYDPTRDELFTAERGRGAWLNQAPIRVANAQRLLDAVLCTGFPYDVHQTLDEIIAMFSAFVGRARGVRRFGSAALDLCYVACGRLDGFWEQRLNPWDIAAGALLVEEAGGRVTNWSGGAFRARHHQVVAANAEIHAQMLDVIAQVEPHHPRTRN